MQTTITIPYNFVPRGYQVDLLTAPQRFKVFIVHRRGGKSLTVFNEQVRKTQDPKFAGKTFYYLLPTYGQCKRVIWDDLVRKHVPMEIVSKLNSSELTIYYKNGSIQRFCGCEDWKLLKGINPIDVVFDEYQKITKEVWLEVIQPILRENGGTATFIGTPEGKNQLWEILQFAKQNPMSWYWDVKTVDDTKGLSQEELDDMRGTMPEAMFQQEMYCAFNENAGSVFHRVRDCLYEPTYPSVAQAGHIYRIGIDLAKYNDWTVLTPFDESTFMVLPQDRFNQVDWMIQESMIKACAYKFGNAQLIVDSTGVGNRVLESLEDMGLNIGEQGRVVFTEKSRKDMINNLVVLIENGKIRIPNDEGLITELESMKYVLKDSGHIKMEVPRGMTDDRIFSLALSVYGVTKPIGVIDINNPSGSYNNQNNNIDNLYGGI